MDKNTIGFLDNEKPSSTKKIWIHCPDKESEYDSQSKWKKFNSTPADFANCVHIHHCKNYEPKDNKSDCVGGYYEFIEELRSKSEQLKYSEKTKDIIKHLKASNPIHAKNELCKLIKDLEYE